MPKGLEGVASFYGDGIFMQDAVGQKQFFEQGNANICFIKFSLPCFT